MVSAVDRHRYYRALSLSLFLLLAGVALGTVFAQDYRPRVSPPAEVSQTLGEATEISIAYSRPAVKGRKVWGELVPLGQVWRTGANEATVFSTNADLIVNGQELAAGSYALFTIPGEKEWTLIFNKNAQQWGAYDYEADKDALRFTVMPQAAPHAEWLDMRFEALDGASASLVIHWEKVKVAFTVATTRPGEKIRKSLKAGFSQTIGYDTRIDLVYSRPGVKGRKIWGELVPFGQVWRTGANENTVFKVSSDVLINGRKLSAGSYGLQTIPGDKEWTVIFSKTDGLWGSGKYDAANDALRVTAIPRNAAAIEWLQLCAPSLTLSEKQISAAELLISWDKLAVPFTVSMP